MAQPKAVKKHRWAMKVQVGTALPADNGTYKMPVSAGVTVERKLNESLGIETGLLYSNLRSAGQHLHYLGIPVKVNVTLVDTKNPNFDLVPARLDEKGYFTIEARVVYVRTNPPLRRPSN